MAGARTETGPNQLKGLGEEPAANRSGPWASWCAWVHPWLFVALGQAKLAVPGRAVLSYKKATNGRTAGHGEGSWGPTLAVWHMADAGPGSVVYQRFCRQSRQNTASRYSTGASGRHRGWVVGCQWAPPQPRAACQIEEDEHGPRASWGPWLPTSGCLCREEGAVLARTRPWLFGRGHTGPGAGVNQRFWGPRPEASKLDG